MTDVALVTCRQLPEPDADEELLLAALSRAGLKVDMLAWDDASADPSMFSFCILRSCWNYHLDPESFLAWISSASSLSNLLNPEQAVRWNLHKKYLKELEQKGTPIIPTVVLEKREHDRIDEVIRGHSGDFVVKPAISASSFQTKRFRHGEREQAMNFARTLMQERDIMIQPYMQSVENVGERSLVWIDGKFTHAVRKTPRFAQDEERVSEGLTISDRELRFAEKALACVPGDLLYARVDLVEDDGGELLVSELEVIEPSLFLLQSPDALQRFVSSVRRRCSG